MLEKLPESLGIALINQRAGMENVVYNELYRQRATARMELGSKSFVFNGKLPVRFTADGTGVSPPLHWGDAPPGTESIALIVEDADSPTPHPLVHAIVVGLGVDEELEEAALDSKDHRGIGLTTGQNSFLRHAWLPPDPPPGHGQHRYVFQVFALPAGASFENAPGRSAFIEVILQHAIGVGCLIGTYEREQEARVDDAALIGVAPEAT
jgi:Raf kinase inhibitor-like YbhB/YbcL family protein